MEDAPADCNKLDDSFLGGRDDCWTNQAEDKKDVTVCNNIEGTTKKSTCVANVAIEMDNFNSLFLCGQADGIDRDYCSRLVLKNPKFADMAINHCERVDADRRDNCYVNIAILSDEPNICKYSSHPSRCWGVIAATYRMEIRERACDDAPKPDECKDFMDTILKKSEPKSDTPILDALENLGL